MCLVCVGTGRFDREYMAGVVQPSRATLAKVNKAREGWRLAKVQAELEQKKDAAERRLEDARKTWQLPRACGEMAFYRHRSNEALLKRLRAAGLDCHEERIRQARRAGLVQPWKG